MTPGQEKLDVCLGGRGYQVRGDQTVYGDERNDFDSDFDLDEDAKEPRRRPLTARLIASVGA